VKNGALNIQVKNKKSERWEKIMRDPKRIDRIMKHINEIWTKLPDMRFYQIISMLEHEYSKANNDFGRKDLIYKERIGSSLDAMIIENPHPIVDLFYLEDDVLEKFLEDYKSKV
jgi:uncharacterized protein YihD (DUF1040 family)